MWDVNTGTHIRTLTGHTRSIMSVSFSPDETLASGGYDATIRLWDVNTGTHIRTLTGGGTVHKISFNPNGDLLASAGWFDKSIHVWNVSMGNHLHTLIGHTGWVTGVSFSFDGQTLASGSYDETVRLWDVSTGAHLRTFIGHTGPIESVVFSPDRQIIASGGWDGTVLLWEISHTSPEPGKVIGDINADGIVNIQDLVFVASNFGQTGENVADVNGDGLVNIIDLTLVAGAFGNTAGAPSMWNLDEEIALTREQVQQWLHQARQINLTDTDFQRGLLMLEQLLASLTPKKTVLLPNYPNPFNPETWIPYQLAAPVDVSIAIYSADGKLVRRLDLGHQPVGIYESRSRAAYWDGRNALGEPVASGVYFYTLTADEFTATRKMLIQK